jgi:flagellar biosynthesis protein FlhG
MEANKESLKSKLAPGSLNHKTTVSEKASKVFSIPVRSDNDAQKAKAMAQRYQIPFVDPLRAKVEPTALRLLAPEMALKHRALPIRLVDKFLLVAMMSPEEPIAIKSLQLLTGCRIRPAIAPKNSLFIALKKYYGNGNGEGPEIKDSAKNKGKKAQPKAPKKIIRSPDIVSVFSNKGGVGKTHLSINVACGLVRTGAKVLLIDADLGNADISNKLGLFPKLHLINFLEKKKQMHELVCRTEFGFDLIASSYGEFQLANLYHAQKVRFIKHFIKVSQSYDFAVFDLGAGISRVTLDFALAADHTIILTTPQDVISGYACIRAGFYRFKQNEESLEQRLPDYQPRWTFSPMLGINQVDNFRQGVALFETIKKWADKNINSVEDKFRIKPEYLGAIPYDSVSLRAAEVKRKPLLFTSPHIKAAQSIQHMCSKFSCPEATYDPKIKFKHPLRRFAAILSQKL